MTHEACPTVQEFAADARRRTREFILGSILLGLALGGCLVLFSSPAAPFAGIVAAGVLILLWHRPRTGVLLLFAIALVLEVDRSHFPTRGVGAVHLPFFVTYSLPLFRPLQEIVRGSGMILSGVELCMATIAGFCLVQAIYERRFRFQGGAFARPFAILFAWWIFAAANGIATGGSPKLAFLEIRTPAYALALYFLTYNLLTRRRDLDILGWMIVIGAGLRAMQGLYLYAVTYHGDLSWSATGASLLEHHESFPFNAFFFFTLLLFLTNGPKPLKFTALALFPIVAIVNTLNARRASTGATMLALVILLPVLYVAFKERRASILRLVAAGGVLTMLYVGAFWNSSSVVAQPIRAIRSQFTPDARDASSDEYRKLENKNIYFTIHTSPIFGFGFGKEFLRPYPMIDLRKEDPYLFLLPHNSVLWVWLRLGTLGFLFYLWMNGKWVVCACRTASRHTEPWIRRWALFAVVIVAVNFALAFLDMGQYGPRTQIYLGVVLGVLDRLPLMASTADGSEDR